MNSTVRRSARHLLALLAESATQYYCNIWMPCHSCTHTTTHPLVVSTRNEIWQPCVSGSPSTRSDQVCWVAIGFREGLLQSSHCSRAAFRTDHEFLPSTRWSQRTWLPPHHLPSPQNSGAPNGRVGAMRADMPETFQLPSVLCVGSRRAHYAMGVLEIRTTVLYTHLHWWPARC